jgi:hypothetical protein
VNLSEINEYFKFKEIIIDSSNSLKSSEAWTEENKLLDFDLYNVKSKGAFIVKI